MRSMTTAEARENFGDLLELLKRGETVELTTAGITVGKVVPEPGTVAERFAEVLKKYPLDADALDDLERTVREMRESIASDERERPAD